ncbi:MAG: universal stress protein [Solirubrobacteraceae bacterium]
MFKRIMWATDGSENADRALAVAKSLASEETATLTIVHIVQKIATSGDKALGWYANEELVEAKVEQVASQLSKEGVNVSVKMVTHVGPQPAHQIAELAREAGADLIVVGSRGHGVISGLVLGSVTQRLLHVAPCPVLVVPPVDPAAREEIDESERTS